MFGYTTTVEQRRFDDLGTPLSEVTFCIIDLETTGGSASADRITEVGAVRVRGGECLGTLQTFVNPGRAIPPSITVLTGITEAMVMPAPTIDAVLPSILEFIGDAVVVGHNVRFDVAFLDAALERSGRDRLTNRRVDTCGLARRLVRDEVPNCKLGTLASRFCLPNQPSHRALDDALATADLLHVLLERASGLGVTGLDDLVALPTMAGHAQASKLSLTSALPRTPGVYLFGNGRGDVLYVGKATNLRSRVRSYFSGDERRKVGALLRQTGAIDHIVCVHPLEAEVREVRLIQSLTPRYNRHAADPTRYRYVRLSPTESGLQATVTPTPRPGAAVHLGPVSSASGARRVVGALAVAVPGVAPTSRRRPSLDLPVPPTPLGTPLDDTAIHEALISSPVTLLTHLEAVMTQLAVAERFEEAATLRDQAASLGTALDDYHRLGWLATSGRLVVEVPGYGGAELEDGLLRSVWGPDGQIVIVDTPVAPQASLEPTDRADATAEEGPVPISRWHVDELRVVSRWLDRHAGTLRLLEGSSGPASMWPRPPRFRAGGEQLDRRVLAA